VTHYQSGDDEGTFSTVQHPLSKALRGQVSGIESIANTYMWSAQISIPKADNSIKKIYQNRIGFAEELAGRNPES